MDLAEALFREEQWSSRSALAREIGTSPGALSTWADYLEFFRVLRDRPGGLEVDRRRLLSTLTAYRVANLRPERPARIQGDVEEVHERLDAQGLPHTFGMFTAANRWAFFEPHRDVHLYVDRGHRREVMAALDDLRASGPGASGELQMYVENLDALSSQDRQGLPVTSPLQTTIDLRAHPEGGAHADFLEENLLPRLQERSG